MPVSAQRVLALSALRHGSSLMLFGLCWGFTVPNWPYPRMALTAHIGATGNSMSLMLIGVILCFEDVVKLKGAWKRIILQISPWWLWASVLSECANAAWGAKGILPIAAQLSGSTGATAWQEAIVTGAHAVGGLIYVACWGAVVHTLFTGVPAETVTKKE
ncbi:hypothetical protein CALCODRAFT_479761 [Calocera cornea HHB12733]|uniref:Uncharacterized protein n=1 Tax=Calocera cornea HHB12733 TaxID=1353952 RepID=A0A165JEI8_9BASI|nr:hypothetical protein CALCODRAFT_479761 [Calocera cornea HHB12733]